MSKKHIYSCAGPFQIPVFCRSPMAFNSGTKRLKVMSLKCYPLTKKKIIPSFMEISQLLLKVEIGGTQTAWWSHWSTLLCFKMECRLRIVPKTVYIFANTWQNIMYRNKNSGIHISTNISFSQCNVLWLINVPAPPLPLKILLQFWLFKTLISFPFVRVHVSAFSVVTMAFYTDCLLSVSNMACRLAASIPRSPGKRKGKTYTLGPTNWNQFLSANMLVIPLHYW